MFKIWVEVLERGDLVNGLTRLGLLESAGDDRVRIPCPEWLVLAMPGLAQHQHDAPYIAGFLLSPAIESISKVSQGLLVARSLQALIRIRHFVAARELVEWICSSPPPASIRPSLHLPQTFSRCLAALSSDSPKGTSSYSSPSSTVLHPLRDLLKATSVHNDIKPTLAMYWPLFSPALIPTNPSQAEKLLYEMKEAVLEVPSELVDAVFRVYAASSDVEGANSFLVRSREAGFGSHAIKTNKFPRETSEAPPVSTSIPQTAPTETNNVAPSLPSRRSLRSSATQEKVPNLSELHSLPLPLHASASSTTLSMLGTNPHTALAYFDSLPAPDSITWSSLLHTLGRSPTTSSAQIISVLTSFQNQTKVRPNVQAWTIAFNALARRGDFKTVRVIWESRLEKKFAREGIKIDLRLITVLMRCFIADGEISKAEELLKQYVLRERRRKGARTKLGGRLQTPKLDIVPLNLLLSSYNRSGNYKACYDLFQRVTETNLNPSLNILPSSTSFSALVDVASFTILFDAARHASAYAGSGYGPGKEKILERRLINRELDPVVIDDRWEGGMSAWRVAAEKGWEVLEKNWPQAVRQGLVGNPMRKRKTSGGFVKWIFNPGWDSEGNPKDARSPHDYKPFEATLFASTGPPVFPQIYPNQPFFRSFIQLLGYHGSQESIPLLLSWMKYLNVKPDRGTLTLALMYVGEATADVDDLSRLREWLMGWIGETKVPREDEVAKFRSGR